MSKKSSTILTVVLIIAAFIIGFATGHFSKSNANTAESTTVDSTAQTSKADVSEDSMEEDILPYAPYESMFPGFGSQKVIDNINSNPLDKKYSAQYNDAKNSSEELEVINAWADAYEKEFDVAYEYLYTLIQKNQNNTDEDKNNYLDALKSYSDSVEGDAEALANFAFSGDEFILGDGSGHSYDFAITRLNTNRTNTLRLIECIYLLNSNYTWATV